MSAELLIANFLRIAAEDLEGARVLSLHDNRNAILLVRAGGREGDPRGRYLGRQARRLKHDLAEMVDLVPDENPLKSALRAIEHLSQYATAYRYPVSSSRTKRIQAAPATEDLRNAIAATTEALNNAIKHFRVDIKRPDSPAGFAGPIR